MDRNEIVLCIILLSSQSVGQMLRMEGIAGSVDPYRMLP